MSKSYNRLDKDQAAVLLVDHQAGLLSLVRDFEPDRIKNNVLALADLAKYFRLPTILTTSFEDGPKRSTGARAEGGLSRCALHSAPRPDQRVG